MPGNTRKVSLKAQGPKPTESRAETVSERPNRQSIKESYRNILTVEGKDPNYEYRWILDRYGRNDDDAGTYHPGQRIMRFQNSGWELVYSSEVSVGESHVYKTENVGSIVRIPAGQGEFQYLMKIKKEWYDEDQANKQEEIDEIEESMGRAGKEGQYGIQFETKFE